MTRSKTLKPSPKGKKQKTAIINAIPLRLSDDLNPLVSEGAAKLELSEPDTIRMAATVGLERLARTNWDLASALESATGAQATPPAPPMVVTVAPAGPPVGLGTGQRIPPAPGHPPAANTPKPEPTPEQLAASRSQRKQDLNRLCAGRPQ